MFAPLPFPLIDRIWAFALASCAHLELASLRRTGRCWRQASAALSVVEPVLDLTLPKGGKEEGGGTVWDVLNIGSETN